MPHEQSKRLMCLFWDLGITGCPVSSSERQGLHITRVRVHQAIPVQVDGELEICGGRRFSVKYLCSGISFC